MHKLPTHLTVWYYSTPTCFDTGSSYTKSETCWYATDWVWNTD